MGKKKGAKYEQVIEAAIKVISQHGYHNAKVSQIAKEAGVADGTIYLYFKNKDDILISLFKEKMSVFVEIIRNALEKQETMEEKLKTLVTLHFKQLANNPEYAVVTQLELRQSSNELRYHINESLVQYLRLIEGIIKEGVDIGAFDSNLHLKIARQMIFGALDEVITNWVMNDCKHDLVACAEPVYHMLLLGIKTRENN
ncbi:transcriptional regulator, TetR family [Alteribacillus persepolensis]|uniref:Transcriptional regulator, TetR family n=1 Tax=Alteribacillus persepolensis TaxID=568899 RepID=A0A1G8BMT3_9BACI|nr:TetR/AcrR family transcriptional regulator [Alteribacillus persepolensis]SDH34529.1 transcriptional regulator, TetR family [Alteribacillus persepolensis]